MKENKATFEYKEAEVTVTVRGKDQKPLVRIDPPGVPETLKREVGAIAVGYDYLFKEDGEFPSFEDAKVFAASILIYRPGFTF